MSYNVIVKYSEDCKYYYKPTSDPTSEDGDDDLLLDADEREIGSNALLPDTDGDLLKDGFEDDIGSSPLLADSDGDETFPLYQPYADFLEYVGRPADPMDIGNTDLSKFIPGDASLLPALEVALSYADYLPYRNQQLGPDDIKNVVKNCDKLLGLVAKAGDTVIMETSPIIYEKHFTIGEAYREYILGLVLGDYREFAGLGDHDNNYYLIGQLTSCLFWIGSVRDCAAAINHWDPLSFVVNGLFGGLQLGVEAKIVFKAGTGAAKGVPRLLEKLGAGGSGKLLKALVIYLIVVTTKDLAKEPVVTKEMADAAVEAILKDTLTEGTINSLKSCPEKYTSHEILILSRADAPLDAIAKAHTSPVVIDNCKNFKKQMLLVYGKDAWFTADEFRALGIERSELAQMDKYRAPFLDWQLAEYKKSIDDLLKSYYSQCSRPMTGEVEKYIEGVMKNIKGAYGEFDSLVYLVDNIAPGSRLEFVMPLRRSSAAGPDLVAVIVDAQNVRKTVIVESKNVQELSLSKMRNYINPVDPEASKFLPKDFNVEYTIKHIEDMFYDDNIERYLTDIAYPDKNTAMAAARADARAFAEQYFKNVEVEYYLVLNGKDALTIKSALSRLIPQILPSVFKSSAGTTAKTDVIGQVLINIISRYG